MKRENVRNCERKEVKQVDGEKGREKEDGVRERETKRKERKKK